MTAGIRFEESVKVEGIVDYCMSKNNDDKTKDKRYLLGMMEYRETLRFTAFPTRKLQAFSTGQYLVWGVIRRLGDYVYYMYIAWGDFVTGDYGNFF